MKKVLTYKDFKLVKIIDSSYSYLSTKLPNGREVCLEPCLNGFDVAIYDGKQNIIGLKECTNLDFNLPQHNIVDKAIEIANRKINTLTNND